MVLTHPAEVIDEDAEDPIIPSLTQLEDVANSGLINSVSNGESEDNEL